jgi:hypothetical protein
MSATTTLESLILVSPAFAGTDFSIDAESLELQVLASPLTASVTVQLVEANYSVTFGQFSAVSDAIHGAKRLFKCTVDLSTMDHGTYTLSLVGADTAVRAGATQITPSLNYNMILQPRIMNNRALPPSGVRILRHRDFCRIEWVVPSEFGFQGVRVLFSTDESGITIPYQQFGSLVSNVTRISREIFDSSSTSVEDTQYATITTTKTDQYVDVNYSSVDIDRATVGSDEFFVSLSTVILDTATNHVFESQANGPFKCGFVDLRKVNPTDFIALQDQSDIAGRLITSATEKRPDLDLSPRSEARDVFIDPISIELSNASIREWFARVCTSVSALSQLDDADGDGFSDPVATSNQKQLLMRAFGLDETSLQTYIDQQFDVLGERAGITRGGAEAAVSMLYIYSNTKPTTRTLIEVGATVGTIADANTPALTFTVRGSAVMDPSNLDTYFDPESRVWGVSLPVVCDTVGSIGNVGAGAIKKAISGIPSGFLVTNPSKADFGIDRQDNISYASLINYKTITGVDSGTRMGYTLAALSAPGVVDAHAVCAGDLEMQRDWFPARGKHVYGCVDIYVRGRSYSQEATKFVYTYASYGSRDATSSYAPATALNNGNYQVQLDPTAQAQVKAYGHPVVGIAEIFVDRDAGAFYLGAKRSVYNPDTFTITLDPTELSYDITPLGEPVYRTVPNSAAFSAAAVRNADGRPTVRVLLRFAAPIKSVPTIQPVSSVYSITGESDYTGYISPSSYRLIHGSNPLLDGMSQRAGDAIQVDNSLISISKVVQFQTGGPDTLFVDEGMVVPVDGAGTPGPFLSVRSADFSTTYTYRSDYAVVSTGTYGCFSIKRLPGSTIPLDTDIVVGYNRYKIREQMILVEDEPVVLRGTAPVPLANAGVVTDVFWAWTHDALAIIADPLLNGADPVKWDKRYLKVTIDRGNGPELLREKQDYDVSYNPVTGTLTINRYVSSGAVDSGIPDAATVLVTYYRREVFDIVYGFPDFVTSIANTLETTKHGAADVLVKTMHGNSVDITLTVELEPDATPEIVDAKVRTSIGMVLDLAKGQVSQAEVIRQIKSITGVRSVVVPLTHFAKSDGSLQIGHLIPAGTKWTKISDAALSNQDFIFSALNMGALASSAYITASPVLPTNTIPSGGTLDAPVSFMYEGEEYARVFSLREFAASTTPSFYIIGVGDKLDENTSISSAHYGRILFLPPVGMSPASYPFRVTYEIWNEAGAKDLTLSPIEYVGAGRVSIDYIQGGRLR